jgi:hypothetical protein
VYTHTDAFNNIIKVIVEGNDLINVTVKKAGSSAFEDLSAILQQNPLILEAAKTATDSLITPGVIEGLDIVSKLI